MTKLIPAFTGRSVKIKISVRNKRAAKNKYVKVWLKKQKNIIIKDYDDLFGWFLMNGGLRND